MRVICWDFDGTLAYSDSLWSRSVLAALDEAAGNHGVQLDEIRRCMSSGFTWHTPNEDYSSFVGEKWWERMNSHFLKSCIYLGIAPETAEKACCRIRDIIKRKENYRLYADTVSMLKAAKEKGCRNVILSNNYPDLDEVTEKLGLSRFFDGFVVSSLVGYDKPRKEIFDFAKALFPLADDFLMVGDSVSSDIIGGRNAGMKTVLVHNGKNEAADYCFDELSGVCGLL